MELIREIAKVQDLANEFKELADSGKVVGAVLLYLNSDHTFDVAWNAGATEQRVTLVGCLEFLKRDLMVPTTAIGE